jgi:hypothetical protein
MYNFLAPINLSIWLVAAIIYLIGNLTYADYYTNLPEYIKQIFNAVFGTQAGCFLVNLILATLVEQDLYKGYRYGLGWCTALSLLVYACIVGFGTWYGFRDLKHYFGKKRGKL